MKPSKKESSGRRPFKYRRDRTVEDVSRRSKVSGGSFDMIVTAPMWRPKDGENNFRILPCTWEDTDKWGKDWAIEVYVHFGIGADNSTYLCAEKMNGGDCPICTARGDAENEEEQKALRPTKRVLTWILDRDNDKAGPQVWSMPLKVYKDIQTRSIDKKTQAVLYIDDPDEGFDISFVKEGKGIGTQYNAIEISRDASPISDKESKQTRWLDFINENTLPDVLNFYPEDHLAKVLQGKSKRDDDDDDDDTPKKGKKDKVERTKSKRRDDDDDEDEVEDEDDEDDKPRKKSKSKARDDDDDDDEDDKPARRKSKRDDDEDEDEDDEDEKPAHHKSKRRDDDDEEETEDDDEDEKPRKKSKHRDDDEDESEDEDDEDEKPARRKSKRRDDDDDDEETEEETEAEDDDEEEKPRKKSKGKARDDDDDADESEDEDEDDGDEKPKGSAAARARAKLEALKKRKGKK